MSVLKMKLKLQSGIKGNRTLLCSKFALHRLFFQGIDVSLNVRLPFRFVLELIHPCTGWQSWICKAVITKAWHRKNAVKDQRIEKDGKVFQIIDMNLATDFPLHIKDPLAAEETEFRKAAILFLLSLETIVYMFPVVRIKIVLL